jgi:hypothetical protein
MQAWTCGVAFSLHPARFCSNPGAFRPPSACMQARTIDLPTVILQFSRAASTESANAGAVDAASKAANTMNLAETFGNEDMTHLKMNDRADLAENSKQRNPGNISHFPAAGHGNS